MDYHFFLTEFSRRRSKNSASRLARPCLLTWYPRSLSSPLLSLQNNKSQLLSQSALLYLCPGEERDYASFPLQGQYTFAVFSQVNLLKNIAKLFKSSLVKHSSVLLWARKNRFRGFVLCPGEDLNLHALAGATTSR